MKAAWQDAVLAESDQAVVIEGNHYFPPDSIRKEYFDLSETHSACPWKGTASYYHIHGGNQNNPDAAWYYPERKVGRIRSNGYVAFWRGVKILD